MCVCVLDGSLERRWCYSFTPNDRKDRKLENRMVSVSCPVLRGNPDSDTQWQVPLGILRIFGDTSLVV